MKFDDSASTGTVWINENGEKVKLRKGGFVQMTNILEPSSNNSLLPEYYLRPTESEIMPIEHWKNKIQKIDSLTNSISGINFSSIYNKLDVIGKTFLGQMAEGFQGKEVPISKILKCMSGNSGLTEEYLYSQINTNGERRYRLLTGSTDYKERMFIHKCPHPKDPSKTISVSEGVPVIHVVRKGKAGSTAFFEAGDYTINDDAYLLYLRKQTESTTLQTNPEYVVNLKWLFYEYRSLFFQYSSSSDNGTWNMTGFFKEVRVDIPSINEQERIVSFYENLEQIEAKFREPYERILELSHKSIK